MRARRERIERARDRALDAALAEHLRAKWRIRDDAARAGTSSEPDVVSAVDLATVNYRERVRTIRRRYARRARWLGWLPL